MLMSNLPILQIHSKLDKVIVNYKPVLNYLRLKNFYKLDFLLKLKSTVQRCNEKPSLKIKLFIKCTIVEMKVETNFYNHLLDI